MTRSMIGLFISLCAGILLLGEISTAQELRPPDHRPGAILKNLDLNQEQREQIKPLREQRKRVVEMFQKLKDERLKLNQLLREDGTTEQEALGQLTVVNELLVEINTQRVKNLIALKKILTPEQRKKLMETLAERRKQIKRGESERRGF